MESKGKHVRQAGALAVFVVESRYTGLAELVTEKEREEAMIAANEVVWGGESVKAK